MEISHVIRGQEFLASVPNYLNLYEALGLDRPVLATMPHILGPDGNKKLSKRDGAKDVLDYIKDGYMPEALVSFIATLGWNDGTEQEIFTFNELEQKFSLDRVQRSGARFDEKRLEWVNGHFIREMPFEELYERTESFWPPEAHSVDDGYKKDVLKLVQERLKFLAELPQLTSFFFMEPTDEAIRELFANPSDKQLGKIDRAEQLKQLEAARGQLAESVFSQDDLANRLNGLLEKLGTKPGVLFAAVRIAVTGASASPQLFGTLKVLGKDKSLARLDKALTLLKNLS
jgi:glutamyl/glutaminyl-tRNA synthetase